MSNEALPGTGRNGDHRVYSSYFEDNNVVQQVAIIAPKSLLIDGLRKVFRNDSIYTYRSDEYGFPLTPDLTGVELGSDQTTNILIGDLYRYEVKFFPAIVIRSGGGSYKPISFNQDMTYKYRKDVFEDAYGARSIVTTPTHKVYSGAWELSFDVQIYAESHSELQELVDITSLALQHTLWHELRANGLMILRLSIGSESAEQYANDYVYNQSISLSTRSEWRIEVPIDNVIERMVFYFESDRHSVPTNADDLTATRLTFSDLLELTEITSE